MTGGIVHLPADAGDVTAYVAVLEGMLGEVARAGLLRVVALNHDLCAIAAAAQGRCGQAQIFRAAAAAIRDRAGELTR